MPSHLAVIFLKRGLAVSHLPSSLLKMQAERRGCGPLYLIYFIGCSQRKNVKIFAMK